MNYEDIFSKVNSEDLFISREEGIDRLGGEVKRLIKNVLGRDSIVTRDEKDSSIVHVTVLEGDRNDIE